MTTPMNRQGRPTRPATDSAGEAPPTFSGNRALDIEEPLIFEVGGDDRSGVDLPRPPAVDSRLGQLSRETTDRPAGPLRTRDDAPLRPPLAQ